MANGNRGRAPEPPASPRPAHEVRLGRVKAAVGANETDAGVRYNVTVCRLYKDQQGRWQTTEGFGRDDLLVLAKVLDRAHTWVCESTKGQDLPP